MDGARTEIFLRPLGSPLPLGLAGLVVASLVVSGLDLGWVPVTAGHDAGLLLLAGSALGQGTGKPLAGLTLGLAAARLLLSALHEAVLPVGRRGRARRDTDGAAREAGVRSQL